MSCFLMTFSSSMMLGALNGGLHFPQNLLAEKHFIEAHPDGVDVGFAVVLSAFDDLRGHVQWRSQNCLSELVFGEEFRESKVRNFYLPVVQQNIG